MPADLSFQDLLQSILDERGVDLRGYKPTSLQRRLQKRMSQVKAATFFQYLSAIRRDPAEITHLLNTILINVTDFFRDPAAWDFLRAEVIPDVLRAFAPGDTIRAWSAGCATGQEAYSLAICIAEHFGASLADYDVKIYATDIDDEALTIARRGEYHTSQMRRLAPELREKYFSGEGEVKRVNRDLRRIVIFGKSDAIHDAPISRISILACRNMLIYLDSATQLHVLKRFHYALQPNGVLFLGKAESLLLHSDLFTPLHAKWRIFRKVQSAEERPHPAFNLRFAAFAKNRAREEFMLLKEYFDSVLETVGQSIVVVDREQQVNSANPATTKVWGLSQSLAEGTPLKESPLGKLCPELPRRVQEAQDRGTTVTFDCKLSRNQGDTVLSLRLRPVFGEDTQLVGTIIYTEDVTPREHLQSTVAELENTSKELQSANEELETTNEELQSLNEELETMNEELQVRTEEMDQLNARYVETLERMPFPVMLLNEQHKIEFWNTLAQKLFGFKSKPAVQLDLEQLPISENTRKLFRRKHQSAMEKNGTIIVNAEPLDLNGYEKANIHFTAVPQGQMKNVLVMIEREAPAGGNSKNNKKKAGTQPAKKNSARRPASKPAKKKAAAANKRR